MYCLCKWRRRCGSFVAGKRVRCVVLCLFLFLAGISTTPPTNRAHATAPCVIAVVVMSNIVTGTGESTRSTPWLGVEAALSQEPVAAMPDVGHILLDAAVDGAEGGHFALDVVWVALPDGAVPPVRVADLLWRAHVLHSAVVHVVLSRSGVLPELAARLGAIPWPISGHMLQSGLYWRGQLRLSRACVSPAICIDLLFESFASRSLEGGDSGMRDEGSPYCLSVTQVLADTTELRAHFPVTKLLRLTPTPSRELHPLLQAISHTTALVVRADPAVPITGSLVVLRIQQHCSF
jgi:hypothetical protein